MQAFDYFESNINYFEGQSATSDEKVVESSDPKNSESKPGPNVGDKFNWDAHLDPKRDEFYMENGKLPPGPVLQTFKYNTKENRQKLRKYLALRRAHFEAFSKKWASETGGSLPSAPASLAGTDISYSKTLKVRDEISFIFYFDRNCPHCKRMYKVVNQLVGAGYMVEAVRVDQSKGPVEGLLIPHKFGNVDEIKKLGGTGVPLLLVLNHESKKRVSLKGYKSLSDVERVLQNGEI